MRLKAIEEEGDGDTLSLVWPVRGNTEALGILCNRESAVHDLADRLVFTRD